MDITAYESPIIVATVWIFIQVTKGLMNEKLQRYIPGICAILGVLLNIWINGGALTPDILLAGMASGFGATGLNEMIVAATSKKN